MNTDRFQELPIVIEAAWDCRPLPLRELLALRPGATLATGLPLAQPLQIRAGGELLGTGELERSENGPVLHVRQFGEEQA